MHDASYNFAAACCKIFYKEGLSKMRTIPVEVVNIGFHSTKAIENAIYFLNKHQKSFEFILLKQEGFETYEAKEGICFKSKEIYDLMDKVFMDMKGFHNLVIGVVEKRLDGTEWGNLFGSMQTNKNNRITGKAIASSYGLENILQSIPIEIYYIFKFLSFSIRFIVGKGMIHDNERGCLFHRMVNRTDILESIRSGYISLNSQKQMNEYMELDQIIAFKTILSIISDIARSNDPQKNFQDFLTKNIGTNQNSERNKVFISYSHADKKWIERLKLHLKPFETKGIIDLWDDTKIKPGMLWREEIKKALDSTKVAVLLVSADFLASDFIIENELPPLLSAAEKEGVAIIPVILRPSTFSTSELGKFLSINPPSKALSGMSEHDQEEVFVKIATTIKEALDRS